MNEKEYKCKEYNKTLIRRHLPRKWSIRTVKSNNKIGYNISYICDTCKQRFNEKRGYL